ncbi:hypothetical protein DP113_01315 [Brasilonema octagenarum UFV-E1]|uniref:Uncharacterized protein n=2 Tax=Brasilonema TaxID=383614 RepID=A0A856M7L7_9CYAN|nr:MULTISPECIES: hypothetical protein [Brasilonema]NMF65411.1 hypothetical protein [Brasilonema octagenarum UFV-OR1]QDL06732.1 hypothetical protein DP114_01325 [Brasilonema sennae CENA114]QDL13101.1 hypothetical protein DP113_01315 [Brasilonema octagenarum UFV-E1]
MKKPFLPFKQLFVLTVAGLSFASLLLPQPSLAEPNSRNILQDLNSQQDNDPLSPRSDEVNNMGMFGLMHRLQQGNATWDPNQQNQQLNDAAAAFKQKQQQLYQQNQQQPNQSGLRVNTPGITQPKSGK